MEEHHPLLHRHGKVTVLCGEEQAEVERSQVHNGDPEREVKGHLGAQVGDQAVFRAGVERHADEQDGILLVNQHPAEPRSLVVVGEVWEHVSERRRRREEEEPV